MRRPQQEFGKYGLLKALDPTLAFKIPLKKKQLGPSFKFEPGFCGKSVQSMQKSRLFGDIKSKHISQPPTKREVLTQTSAIFGIEVIPATSTTLVGTTLPDNDVTTTEKC